uniref:Ig-like domain-containing protein n=1 Tax=Xiphophorus couchianus TaxID=32473 RepID=A0A3B5LYA2_9TELE
MTFYLLWLFMFKFCMFSFPDGFQSHSVSRCLFNSTELKDSWYIYSCIYNKVEFLRFDSNIGLYVGYTSFGMRQANKLNNNPVALSRRRAQKEAFCHHNSGVLKRISNSPLPVPVAPSVTLSSVAPPAGGHPTMLTCSVYGFFPKQIRVTWRRDGQEVISDVTSTAELPDGAWLYQIHSSLEFRPRKVKGQNQNQDTFRTRTWIGPEPGLV